MARLIGPSANAAPGEMYTDQQGPQPHPEAEAMTEADIESAIAGYVSAARNAIAAGFDAVELHGANGYLIEQFLSPEVNTRADRWGGDADGRARFAVEVARRTAGAIGADRVGIRLSPLGAFNGVTPWDSAAADFTSLAAKLGELGLLYVHLVDHSAMGAPPVPESVKASVQAAFGGTVIRCGGYDRARGDADVGAGLTDLVAFGRPYIANPDLVARLQADAPLNQPDFGTFYTPGDEGYLDYPTLES